MNEFIHPDFTSCHATPNKDGFEYTAAHMPMAESIRDSLVAQGLLRESDTAFFADADKRMGVK